MIEYLVMVLSTAAAIIAIADYFKNFIKYKAVIVLLAALLSVSTIYQFKLSQEKNSEEFVASEMRKSAKIVADSIVISGWEETGDYLGYLTQITSFYVRYKSFYPTEANTYSAELSDWRDFFSEKRKARESINSSEIAPLKGLVTSGKEHMVRIAREHS